MGRVKSLNKWANAHSYYLIDIVRVAFGVFLFAKGVDFMSNFGQMAEVIKPFENMPGGMLIIHYIAPAHFVGGFLIVIGLLTRWAVIAQLPLLVGAILVNFLGEMNANNLIVASIALLICLFFIIYGSGKHSSDYYLKMEK